MGYWVTLFLGILLNNSAKIARKKQFGNFSGKNRLYIGKNNAIFIILTIINYICPQKNIVLLSFSVR